MSPTGDSVKTPFILMYINNTRDSITSSLWLFADNSLVYNIIHTVNDAVQLLYDIDKLVHSEKSPARPMLF